MMPWPPSAVNFRQPIPMARHHSVATPLGKALLASGLTATRLSAMTGINSRMMTEHLAGRITPRPDQLAVYSDVLGIDPEDLL